MEGPTTKLYRNGQLIKMSATSQEPEECLRDAQVLGAYLKGDGFHMEGVIGFLRFWNGKILSHEQVGELYEHAEYKRKPAKVRTESLSELFGSAGSLVTKCSNSNS